MLHILGFAPATCPSLAELLHYDAPVTQDALSTALAIDKAATARALDQLEQDGFVTRMVNPENRRQKLVMATAKAKAIQDALYEIFQNAGKVLMRNLSREEANQALRLLNQMIENAMGAIR